MDQYNGMHNGILYNEIALTKWDLTIESRDLIVFLHNEMQAATCNSGVSGNWVYQLMNFSFDC